MSEIGRTSNSELISPELVSAVFYKIALCSIGTSDWHWLAYNAFHNLKSFLICKMFSCPLWGLKWTLNSQRESWQILFLDFKVNY